MVGTGHQVIGIGETLNGDRLDLAAADAIAKLTLGVATPTHDRTAAAACTYMIGTAGKLHHLVQPGDVGRGSPAVDDRPKLSVPTQAPTAHCPAPPQRTRMMLAEGDLHGIRKSLYSHGCRTSSTGASPLAIAKLAIFVVAPTQHPARLLTRTRKV